MFTAWGKGCDRYFNPIMGSRLRKDVIDVEIIPQILAVNSDEIV